MRDYDLIEQLARAKDFYKQHNIVKAVYLACREGIDGEDLRAIESQGLLLEMSKSGSSCVVFLKDGQELPACVCEKLHSNGYKHATVIPSLLQ